MTTPQQIYIASYTNGMDIKRKDLAADNREHAYELGLNRAPHGWKLMNIRKKTGKKSHG